MPNNALILRPLSITPCGYEDSSTMSLLSYFTEKICPLTVSSRNVSSPLSRLVLPFSFSSSPLVLHSVLALSACHRSRTEPAYESRALQLSNRVLADLRSKLSHDMSGGAVLSPETIIVMMMLCLYEIVSQCDKRWVVHLKGARDLIRLRRMKLVHSTSSRSSEDIVSFVERFFAFQDVIGRTACGEEPIFGSDFWEGTRNCDQWMGKRTRRLNCEN